jgi:hypothetical protein
VARRSPLQQHGKGQGWAKALGIAVFIAVCGYLVFEFGRIQAAYNIVEAAKERSAYEERIELLNDEIGTLKDQIAVLETHRDIDREAYKQVEANLANLEQKIQEQTDAIAFYRGIVSPSDGQSGLRVQDFQLTRTASEREYSIRLVLVQAMKHDRKVSGNVKMTIDGELDGVAKSYPITELLPEGADRAWKFSFRYFQDFDRLVVLPDGFTPLQVVVAVESSTRSIGSIEETFTWAAGQG